MNQETKSGPLKASLLFTVDNVVYKTAKARAVSAFQMGETLPRPTMDSWVQRCKIERELSKNGIQLRHHPSAHQKSHLMLHLGSTKHAGGDTAYRSTENGHDGRGDRQEKPSYPVVEQEGILGRGVGTEREAPQIRVARLPPTCWSLSGRRFIVGVFVVGGGDVVVVAVGAVV